MSVRTPDRTADSASLVAPIVARLGGLPIDVLSVFSSDLEATASRHGELTSELEELRQTLVDQLYEAIGDDAWEEERRFFLKVKRAAYNGRPLCRLAEHEHWSAVEEATGPAARRALAVEAEHEALWDRLEEELESCRLAEEEELGRLVEDPFFRCGLSVASPVVGRESERLAAKPPRRFGRRERRLVPTVLRYASRAAFKLSPFSTLTPVAAGRLVDDPEALATTVRPEGTKTTRSLVRVRRHILDRVFALLAMSPSRRRTLRVGRNDSLVELADGRSAYVRPNRFVAEEAEKRLAFRRESLVRLDVDQPVFHTLEELLAGAEQSTPTYGELVDAVAARGMDDDAARARVDQLLDVGWLVFVAPWPAQTGHLEAAMLRWLESTGEALEEEAPVRSALRRLVTLQEELLDSDEPAAGCRRIGAAVDQLLAAGRDLAGLGEEFDVGVRGADHDLYQDVWQSGDDGAEAVVLDEAMAHSLLDEMRPLVRYAHLYDHRLELRRTLGALCSRFAEERGGRPMPLLELFDQVQEHWQSYMKFFLEVRGGEAFASTWNPLELDDLETLAAHRREAADLLEACCEDVEGEGRMLRGEDLEAVLDRFPGHLTEPLAGACLFLQPASADGSLWMVNRMKEGTGRFGSRYAPVMDPETRRRWCDGLARRGTIRQGDEWAELFDVQSVQGDTLNVHGVQTPGALTFPGDGADLADRRRRTLSDLFVHVDENGLAELRDGEGILLLPVHLGVGYLDYMPTLVKFLCAFGPSEMGSIFPRPWIERRPGLSFCERTRVGRIVLHRRSWTFRPVDLLAEMGEEATDAEAFAALTAWRRRHGVPARVFARERVEHPIRGYRHRPQYLDLTSPSFLRLFRSMLEPQLSKLTLTEALPAPEVFDHGPGSRAVELLLDELALSPTAPSASPSQADEGAAEPPCHEVPSTV